MPAIRLSGQQEITPEAVQAGVRGLVRLVESLHGVRIVAVRPLSRAEFMRRAALPGEMHVQFDGGDEAAVRSRDADPSE